MTRDKMKDNIVNILLDEVWFVPKYGIEDESYLTDVERAAERILKLWEFGHTWEIKNDTKS